MPRAWAPKFRVQIPALPLDPGQVTSLDVGFLIWKVELLKETATLGYALRTQDSERRGSGHITVTITGPGACLFTSTVTPRGDGGFAGLGAFVQRHAGVKG